MRGVAALLAAVLLAGLASGCGGGGAEPGAPQGATLVLDFTPNAVHSGIYAARREGLYAGRGLDLTVREPSSSTDAPKLLEAGRTDFAVLDIHDLGIARERGIDLIGVAAIVQRPLASVLARRDRDIARPRDLQGRRVGVTGLPSDDAVVDSEVRADGGDPDRVDRVTIGFNAVSTLAAGKVDAATGFWNAEGVALRGSGVPIRVFKVDDFGAPPYPELVIATTRRTLRERPALVRALVGGTRQGYALAVAHPGRALDDLLAEAQGLDRAEQAAQMRALRADLRPAPLCRGTMRRWAAWDLAHGLLDRPLDVDAAFAGLRDCAGSAG
jgi:putative hydroxymethylpyrimidine transport system substrate-binding protein